MPFKSKYTPFNFFLNDLNIYSQYDRDISRVTVKVYSEILFIFMNEPMVVVNITLSLRNWK